MRRIREHLTYANVMATLAVFIVLGGGAYAAFHLPKNSVRSKNIVNRQVKRADLATHAVNASKLAPPEALHVVGAASGPPFQHGCAGSTGGGNQPPPAFYKDAEGIVHIEGEFGGCAATGNIAFQLP